MPNWLQKKSWWCL